MNDIYEKFMTEYGDAFFTKLSLLHAIRAAIEDTSVDDTTLHELYEIYIKYFDDEREFVAMLKQLKIPVNNIDTDVLESILEDC